MIPALKEINSMFTAAIDSAARTQTAQMPAPLRLPATAAPYAPDWHRKKPAEWTREMTLDAAAEASRDSSAFGSACIERICDELGDVAQELSVATESRDDVRRHLRNTRADLDRTKRDLDVARSLHTESREQLAAARDELAAEVSEHETTRHLLDHAQSEVERLRGELETLRTQRVTVSLERATVKITGDSIAELTAQLNDHVRSRGPLAGYDSDTRVVDVEYLDGDDLDGTIRIPMVTPDQLAAAHGGCR